MTSAAPTTGRTQIRQFSSKRLLNRDVRTVAILAGRGGPCIAITVFRWGQPVTRVLFFAGDELSLLASAVERARDPEFTGRFDAGEFPTGPYVRVRVFAVAHLGRPPAVCFGRLGDGGQRIGGATALAGPELDALEQAVAELQQMTAAQPQRVTEP